MPEMSLSSDSWDLHRRAERDRQRRAETRALHEFNVAREQERRQQAARTAAQAASRERYERQQRERDAQHDRGRLAVLEARQRADQDRQAQAARDNATQDHWRQLDELSAGLSRLLEPPARDHTAERVAALEAELEAQAHERAFASEERRRAAYQERSRAAVARRETRGW